MKREWVALAIASVFLTVTLAQEVKISEPQYVSVFYFLKPSGEFIELEREAPERVPKGIKTTFVVPGEKSPVRFSVDDKLQFVVQVTEDFGKAAKTMQLYQFEAQDRKRQVIVNNVDFRKNKTVLKLIAEKYGSSSLKLVPSQKLAPGEYCLSRSTIMPGFCFGVDAAGNP